MAISSQKVGTTCTIDAALNAQSKMYATFLCIDNACQMLGGNAGIAPPQTMN